LAVTDWRLRRWRLWFLALSNVPRKKKHIETKLLLGVFTTVFLIGFLFVASSETGRRRKTGNYPNIACGAGGVVVLSFRPDHRLENNRRSCSGPCLEVDSSEHAVVFSRQVN